MIDIERREYIAAVLAAAFTSGCSGLRADVLGSRSTAHPPEQPERELEGLVGRIYLELDRGALRETQPSPDDFDIGLTVADGVFAGRSGQWVAQRNVFGALDGALGSGTESPHVVSDAVQLNEAVADEAIDEVFLLPGRYDLAGSGPLTLGSGTSLACQPRTATIIGPPDANVIQAESVDDISLYGLDVQYRERTGVTHANGILTAGCTDVTVENCRVRGARRHGIFLRANDERNAENLAVRHCDVAECDGAGIVVEAVGVEGSARSYVVDGNYVHDIGRTADYLNGTGIACEEITQGIVTNNRVENVSRDGIRAHDAAMVGNLVVDAAQGSDENRMYLWTTADPTRHQSIYGNVAYAGRENGNNATGIRATTNDVTAARNPLAVVGNVVRDEGGNLTTGIEVGSESISVVGNHVRGTEFHGVKVGLFRQSVSNVAVFGNVADHCGHGISTDFDVANIVIAYNVCTNNHDSGIRLRNTTDGTVVYNVLTDNPASILDGANNSGITRTGNL